MQSYIQQTTVVANAMLCLPSIGTSYYPESKVHGAIMGPIWGRQDPGVPHVGPMNFAIWVILII